MPIDPDTFLKKSDAELRRSTFTGDAGSEVHLFGETELRLRYAERGLKAAEQQAQDTRETLELTRKIAKSTFWVAAFTGLVALATFMTVLIARH